jgi:hypothetical protein
VAQVVFCAETGRRLWTVLYGTVVDLIVWVACTRSGGVVGRCLGGTVGGGIDVKIISWCGAWRVSGFTWGILDGMMVGVALGL